MEDTLIFGENTISTCSHTSTDRIDGVMVCTDCGIEIDHLDHEPEWKYYGAGDSKGDSSRCHRYRGDAENKKSFRKLFAETIQLQHINESLIRQTEDRFNQIIKTENGDISSNRGNKRKGIIAACLKHVCDENDIKREPREYRNMFGIKKEDMIAGLTSYYNKFPESRKVITKPCDLIERMMEKLQINHVHYSAIYSLAKQLENSNEELNHSLPNSVAPAIIYVYLEHNPEYKEAHLTKSRFASIVQLSEITISKLTKIINSIIEKRNIKVDLKN